MNKSDQITVNVGGQLFTTTKTTLFLSEYFVSMFNKSWNGKNKNEVMFIDRSGRIFEHVLCLLRDPSYEYPVKYRSELDFYIINIDVVFKEDKLDKVIQQINDLADQINIIGEKLDEIEDKLETDDSESEEEEKKLCMSCMRDIRGF